MMQKITSVNELNYVLMSDPDPQDDNLTKNAKPHQTHYLYAAKMSFLALFVAGMGFIPAVFMAYNSAIYHEAGNLAGNTGFVPDANVIGANDPILACLLALSTCLMLGAIAYQYASEACIKHNPNDVDKSRQYKNMRADLLAKAFTCLIIAAGYGALGCLTAGSFSAVSDIGNVDHFGVTVVSIMAFGMGGLVSNALGLHAERARPAKV